MLLMGSCAIHTNVWFMVVVSHASMVVSRLNAHDHQEKSRHNRATFSSNHAMGTTTKLLSRNQQLNRPN